MNCLESHSAFQRPAEEAQLAAAGSVGSGTQHNGLHSAAAPVGRAPAVRNVIRALSSLRDPAASQHPAFKATGAPPPKSKALIQFHEDDASNFRFLAAPRGADGLLNDDGSDSRSVESDSSTSTPPSHSVIASKRHTGQKSGRDDGFNSESSCGSTSASSDSSGGAPQLAYNPALPAALRHRAREAYVHPEEWTARFSPLVPLIEKGDLHGVMRQWHMLHLEYYNSMPQEHRSHPLLVAIHHFQPDIAAFFVAVGLDLDVHGKLHPYSGDNLSSEAGELQRVNASSLWNLLYNRNIIEGERSRLPRLLKEMRPFLFSSEPAAAASASGGAPTTGLAARRLACRAAAIAHLNFLRDVFVAPPEAAALKSIRKSTHYAAFNFAAGTLPDADADGVRYWKTKSSSSASSAVAATTAASSSALPVPLVGDEIDVAPLAVGSPSPSTIDWSARSAARLAAGAPSAAVSGAAGASSRPPVSSSSGSGGVSGSSSALSTVIYHDSEDDLDDLDVPIVQILLRKKAAAAAFSSIASSLSTQVASVATGKRNTPTSTNSGQQQQPHQRSVYEQVLGSRPFPPVSREFAPLIEAICAVKCVVAADDDIGSVTFFAQRLLQGDGSVSALQPPDYAIAGTDVNIATAISKCCSSRSALGSSQRVRDLLSRTFSSSSSSSRPIYANEDDAGALHSRTSARRLDDDADDNAVAVAGAPREHDDDDRSSPMDHPLLHAVHCLRPAVVQFLLGTGLGDASREGAVMPHTRDICSPRELSRITPLRLALVMSIRRSSSRTSPDDAKRARLAAAVLKLLQEHQHNAAVGAPGGAGEEKRVRWAVGAAFSLAAAAAGTAAGTAVSSVANSQGSMAARTAVDASSLGAVAPAVATAAGPASSSASLYHIDAIEVDRGGSASPVFDDDIPASFFESPSDAAAAARVSTNDPSNLVSIDATTLAPPSLSPSSAAVAAAAAADVSIGSTAAATAAAAAAAAPPLAPHRQRPRKQSHPLALVDVYKSRWIAVAPPDVLATAAAQPPARHRKKRKLADGVSAAGGSGAAVEAQEGKRRLKSGHKQGAITSRNGAVERSQARGHSRGGKTAGRGALTASPSALPSSVLSPGATAAAAAAAAAASSEVHAWYDRSLLRRERQAARMYTEDDRGSAALSDTSASQRSSSGGDDARTERRPGSAQLPLRRKKLRGGKRGGSSSSGSSSSSSDASLERDNSRGADDRKRKRILPQSSSGRAARRQHSIHRHRRASRSADSSDSSDADLSSDSHPSSAMRVDSSRGTSSSSRRTKQPKHGRSTFSSAAATATAAAHDRDGAGAARGQSRADQRLFNDRDRLLPRHTRGGGDDSANGDVNALRKRYAAEDGTTDAHPQFGFDMQDPGFDASSSSSGGDGSGSSRSSDEGGGNVRGHEGGRALDLGDGRRVLRVDDEGIHVVEHISWPGRGPAAAVSTAATAAAAAIDRRRVRGGGKSGRRGDDYDYEDGDDGAIAPSRRRSASISSDSSSSSPLFPRRDVVSQSRDGHDRSEQPRPPRQLAESNGQQKQQQQLSSRPRRHHRHREKDTSDAALQRNILRRLHGGGGGGGNMPRSRMGHPSATAAADTSIGKGAASAAAASVVPSGAHLTMGLFDENGVRRLPSHGAAPTASAVAAAAAASRSSHGGSGGSAAAAHAQAQARHNSLLPGGYSGALAGPKSLDTTRNAASSSSAVSRGRGAVRELLLHADSLRRTFAAAGRERQRVAVLQRWASMLMDQLAAKKRELSRLSDGGDNSAHAAARRAREEAALQSMRERLAKGSLAGVPATMRMMLSHRPLLSLAPPPPPRQTSLDANESEAGVDAATAVAAAHVADTAAAAPEEACERGADHPLAQAQQQQQHQLLHQQQLVAPSCVAVIDPHPAEQLQQCACADTDDVMIDAADVVCTHAVTLSHDDDVDMTMDIVHLRASSDAVVAASLPSLPDLSVRPSLADLSVRPVNLVASVHDHAVSEDASPAAADDDTAAPAPLLCQLWLPSNAAPNVGARAKYTALLSEIEVGGGASFWGAWAERNFNFRSGHHHQRRRHGGADVVAGWASNLAPPTLPFASTTSSFNLSSSSSSDSPRSGACMQLALAQPWFDVASFSYETVCTDEVDDFSVQLPRPPDNWQHISSPCVEAQLQLARRTSPHDEGRAASQPVSSVSLSSDSRGAHTLMAPALIPATAITAHPPSHRLPAASSSPQVPSAASTSPLPRVVHALVPSTGVRLLDSKTSDTLTDLQVLLDVVSDPLEIVKRQLEEMAPICLAETSLAEFIMYEGEAKRLAAAAAAGGTAEAPVSCSISDGLAMSPEEADAVAGGHTLGFACALMAFSQHLADEQLRGSSTESSDSCPDGSTSTSTTFCCSTTRGSGGGGGAGLHSPLRRQPSEGPAPASGSGFHSPSALAVVATHPSRAARKFLVQLFVSTLSALTVAAPGATLSSASSSAASSTSSSSTSGAPAAAPPQPQLDPQLQLGLFSDDGVVGCATPWQHPTSQARIFARACTPSYGVHAAAQSCAGDGDGDDVRTNFNLCSSGGSGDGGDNNDGAAREFDGPFRSPLVLRVFACFAVFVSRWVIDYVPALLSRNSSSSSSCNNKRNNSSSSNGVGGGNGSSSSDDDDDALVHTGVQAAALCVRLLLWHVLQVLADFPALAEPIPVRSTRPHVATSDVTFDGQSQRHPKQQQQQQQQQQQGPASAAASASVGAIASEAVSRHPFMVDAPLLVTVHALADIFNSSPRAAALLGLKTSLLLEVSSILHACPIVPSWMVGFYPPSVSTAVAGGGGSESAAMPAVGAAPPQSRVPPPSAAAAGTAAVNAAAAVGAFHAPFSLSGARRDELLWQFASLLFLVTDSSGQPRPLHTDVAMLIRLPASVPGPLPSAPPAAVVVVKLQHQRASSVDEESASAPPVPLLTCEAAASLLVCDTTCLCDAASAAMTTASSSTPSSSPDTSSSFGTRLVHPHTSDDDLLSRGAFSRRGASILHRVMERVICGQTVSLRFAPSPPTLELHPSAAGGKTRVADSSGGSSSRGGRTGGATDSVDDSVSARMRRLREVQSECGRVTRLTSSVLRALVALDRNHQEHLPQSHAPLLDKQPQQQTQTVRHMTTVVRSYLAAIASAQSAVVGICRYPRASFASFMQAVSWSRAGAAQPPQQQQQAVRGGAAPRQLAGNISSSSSSSSSSNITPSHSLSSPASFVAQLTGDAAPVTAILPGLRPMRVSPITRIVSVSPAELNRTSRGSCCASLLPDWLMAATVNGVMEEDLRDVAVDVFRDWSSSQWSAAPFDSSTPAVAAAAAAAGPDADGAAQFIHLVEESVSTLQALLGAGLFLVDAVSSRSAYAVMGGANEYHPPLLSASSSSAVRAGAGGAGAESPSHGAAAAAEAAVFGFVREQYRAQLGAAVPPGAIVHFTALPRSSRARSDAAVSADRSLAHSEGGVRNYFVSDERGRPFLTYVAVEDSPLAAGTVGVSAAPRNVSSSSSSFNASAVTAVPRGISSSDSLSRSLLSHGAMHLSLSHALLFTFLSSSPNKLTRVSKAIEAVRTEACDAPARALVLQAAWATAMFATRRMPGFPIFTTFMTWLGAVVSSTMFDMDARGCALASLEGRMGGVPWAPTPPSNVLSAAAAAAAAAGGGDGFAVQAAQQQQSIRLQPLLQQPQSVAAAPAVVMFPHLLSTAAASSAPSSASWNGGQLVQQQSAISGGKLSIGVSARGQQQPQTVALHRNTQRGNASTSAAAAAAGTSAGAGTSAASPASTAVLERDIAAVREASIAAWKVYDAHQLRQYCRKLALQDAAVLQLACDAARTLLETEEACAIIAATAVVSANSSTSGASNTASSGDASSPSFTSVLWSDVPLRLTRLDGSGAPRALSGLSFNFASSLWLPFAVSLDASFVLGAKALKRSSSSNGIRSSGSSSGAAESSSSKRARAAAEACVAMEDALLPVCTSVLRLIEWITDTPHRTLRRAWRDTAQTVTKKPQHTAIASSAPPAPPQQLSSSASTYLTSFPSIATATTTMHSDDSDDDDDEFWGDVDLAVIDASTRAQSVLTHTLSQHALRVDASAGTLLAICDAMTAAPPSLGSGAPPPSITAVTTSAAAALASRRYLRFSAISPVPHAAAPVHWGGGTLQQQQLLRLQHQRAGSCAAASPLSVEPLTRQPQPFSSSSGSNSSSSGRSSGVSKPVELCLYPFPTLLALAENALLLALNRWLQSLCDAPDVCIVTAAEDDVEGVDDGDDDDDDIIGGGGHPRSGVSRASAAGITAELGVVAAAASPKRGVLLRPPKIHLPLQHVRSLVAAAASPAPWHAAPAEEDGQQGDAADDDDDDDGTSGGGVGDGVHAEMLGKALRLVTQIWTVATLSSLSDTADAPNPSTNSASSSSSNANRGTSANSSKPPNRVFAFLDRYAAPASFSDPHAARAAQQSVSSSSSSSAAHSSGGGGGDAKSSMRGVGVSARVPILPCLWERATAIGSGGATAPPCFEFTSPLSSGLHAHKISVATSSSAVLRDSSSTSADGCERLRVLSTAIVSGLLVPLLIGSFLCSLSRDPCANPEWCASEGPAAASRTGATVAAAVRATAGVSTAAAAAAPAMGVHASLLTSRSAALSPATAAVTTSSAAAAAAAAGTEAGGSTTSVAREGDAAIVHRMWSTAARAAATSTPAAAAMHKRVATFLCALNFNGGGTGAQFEYQRILLRTWLCSTAPPVTGTGAAAAAPAWAVHARLHAGMSFVYRTAFGGGAAPGASGYYHTWDLLRHVWPQLLLGGALGGSRSSSPTTAAVASASAASLETLQLRRRAFLDRLDTFIQHPPSHVPSDPSESTRILYQVTGQQQQR